MRTILLCFFIILIVDIKFNHGKICGCKTTRKCYLDMVNALKDKDEESCVEDASIGSSTILIYLKALRQYCTDYIKVTEDAKTFEGRNLYEVVIQSPEKDDKADERVLIIEAGQLAGTESVGLALFLIEQLMACEEYEEMIRKCKWVILPFTNPDGTEYGRFNRLTWKKNVRPADDKFSFGVDISRNFEYEWGTCDTDEVGFSPTYPGKSVNSENETKFITSILTKYKSSTKLYLSIRRDGHAILYPYAYSNNEIPNNNYITKVAADVAAKVNTRAGGVQMFLNDSIFEANGKAHCGHSVDKAFDMGAPLAFEMRVFLGHDSRIVTKFQQLPRGYENALRTSYFSGIREMYNAIVDTGKGKDRQG